MTIQFIFMILGDFLLVISMGFYAGVGIWESGTLRHITGMLLPPLAVWRISAVIFKLYSDLPQKPEPVHWKQFPKLADQLIKFQKPWSLLAVWAVTCLFACLWQAFYWRNILHSASYKYPFGIQTLLWYASSYGVFLVLWRFFWTIFTAISLIAKEKKILHRICDIIGVLILLYIILGLIIDLRYRSLKYTVDTVPEGAPRTALVFGAGIYRNGQPSAVLVDRVNTAIELYQKGLIDEMIMSGDNSDRSLNEVDHMAAMALEAGIPEEAILRDNEGWHSSESCWNALNVFGKDEVIFISQDFHLVRILMTAKSFGLSGIGVKADRRIYNISSWATWYFLELVRMPMYWLYYQQAFSWLP